ncbi:MAG: ABC transporter substrate-binding protein [Beijerinckiaceae bacterium]|nr:ABC transporter substrate-binding protein [Beijerinckiaceae bacterium]
MKFRMLLACVVLANVGWLPAQASPDKLKIGVLTDMSGLYADLSGAGSVFAAERAVSEMGGKINGKDVEVIFADHQNKTDIASGIARKWFEQDGVDVIVNAAGSAVALSMVPLARSYNKAVLVTGALSAQLSNEACSANSVHYGLDTYALANGTVRALVGQGKKSWFFIAADYAFGKALVKDSEAFIKKAGGTVKGVVYHPLNSTDFSSYLLQAQATGADVIAMANGGSDLVNTMKQANEFGLTSGPQSLAALVLFITDVNAMGLDKAQGMILTEGFYWNRNEGSRAFAEPFFKMFNRMPTVYQAADYSAVGQYLKAAGKVGWADGASVVAEMKKGEVNDFFAGGGRIREDGLLVHDLILAKVKKPGEVKQPWDYYDVLQTIPGDSAFQSLADSRCPLVKK